MGGCGGTTIFVSLCERGFWRKTDDHRKGEDEHSQISDNIREASPGVEGVDIDAVTVWDGFVPEVVHRDAAEACEEEVCD